MEQRKTNIDVANNPGLTTRSKSRLNTKAKPFTPSPVPQYDGPFDTPQQTLQDTAYSNKPKPQEWEKALIHRIMKIGSHWSADKSSGTDT